MMVAEHYRYKKRVADESLDSHETGRRAQRTRFGRRGA